MGLRSPCRSGRWHPITERRPPHPSPNGGARAWLAWVRRPREETNRKERATVRRQGFTPRPASNHCHSVAPAEHATPDGAESSQWLRLASVFLGSAWQLSPSRELVFPDRRTLTTSLQTDHLLSCLSHKPRYTRAERAVSPVCTRSPCRRKQADPRHWIAVAEPGRPRQTATAIFLLTSSQSLFL